MKYGQLESDSESEFSSPPLNTAESFRNYQADVGDVFAPVVITHSGFHGKECAILIHTKLTRDAELWETYHQMVFPCRACWTPTFVAQWQEQVRLRHHDCAPRSRLRRPSGYSSIGHPEPVPPEALRRVLRRNGEGLSRQVIVRELRGLGIEIPISAIRRAVDREPPYDAPIYDPLYG